MSRTHDVNYYARVTFLDWLAAVVLSLHLPVPLYWFVVHPQLNFWRRHRKAAYAAGLLVSWPPVIAFMAAYHAELFRSSRPPAASVTAGLALILFEMWIFWRVKRDLGAARLVGQTELSGGGEIARHGIYARLRHPRYVGSFLAILGACLIAGTRAMWMAAAAWAALALVAISFEERELSIRFGAAYEEYSRSVPRFIPRLVPRRGVGDTLPGNRL
ncbi:MAG: isoprenylcysteine carboxylmethyltransferase family protein [Candidatus Acidiferrales bacterium]